MDQRDRHSRSRKSKNRNSSERGCRSKFASLLIRIILSGLEETWNLLDPLSVWKRLVLFNFRVCRISCNAEYEILGSQTLKDLEFYVRYSRSLLSTVPHSDIWLEIRHIRAHIRNMEFVMVSDTTRIFHYSEGDTLVLASNLAFEIYPVL